MSTFKTQVARDLAVFLDTDVFGETRDIDGSPVACVLDQDLKARHTAEGVFISEALLHLRTSDLPTVPVVDQRMVIDGQRYTVVHVSEAMGILSVRLRWFES